MCPIHIYVYHRRTSTTIRALTLIQNLSYVCHITGGPGRGLARHRETGPRVSGRGCGNRLRRNTRHENNRSGECTSDASAAGASETRINTRLFTYGVRERAPGAGPARRGGESLQSARCNYILAPTSEPHPYTRSHSYYVQ